MEKQTKLTLTSDLPGAHMFMLGNEALARGAIEAGVRVVAAYPGTPSTEIVDTLLNHRQNLENMYVEWSVNEKVAFGLAFGASMCGARGLAVMKHVGVNVALDSIMTAAYIGAKGGLVMVEAEDPGQWSSSNEQDNRFLAEQSYLPVLEPSSAQEAKDMLVDAFRLSEEFRQPFIIRSATRIGHSRSDIALGTVQRNAAKYTLEKDPDTLVMLPAVARKHRRLMIERLNQIKEAVNAWPYNHITQVKDAKLGIITSGIAYGYVSESLRWTGLQDKISILKIGTPYPLPEKLIQEFLQNHSELLIVEELEPYLENHIRALSQRWQYSRQIHGKDILPMIGEYSVRKVTEAICLITGLKTPADFQKIDQAVKDAEPLLPYRPPSLCAGCPHRSSHFIIKSVCDRIKRETGIDPVRPGDIGCNCLGVHPPLNAIDISTCMGGGFDLSNGIARVSDAPIVAHLGDSTFFHSGMAPMVNAVYNNAKITMIVLDNLTTAMTGAQPSPATGNNLISSDPSPIRPEDIARACGIKYIEVVDPQDLTHSMQVLEKAIYFNGPSFVVFRRACAIIEQREKKARGEKIIPYRVQEDKCINHSPPYCSAACPLHIDVRGYVKLVKEKEYDAALNLIQEQLPFAGILGRVCTHPCQSRCKRGELDDPVEIMALKRTAADRGKSDGAYLKVAPEKDLKVAIIGGGPAGLTAAYDLRKNGYQVTIFEASSELGGLLVSGIPDYRLPVQIASQEIALVLKMGIKVELNTTLGRDIQLAEIQKQFNAVFVAIGAHKANPFTINKQVVNGTLEGLHFLKQAKSGQQPALGKKVAVIGGGNVAVDCARSALRAGCSVVTLVYRRDRPQMPAIPREIDEAEREGIKLELLAAPESIITDAQTITGLQCLRMRLGQPDKSGRPQPEPIPGSSFIIEADTIIAAVGERPDTAFLAQSLPQLVNPDGLISADPLTLSTPIAGVFAGGDAVSGAATVIDAMASGRKAAVSIDKYLHHQSMLTGREYEGSQNSLLQVSIEGLEKKPVIPPPVLAVSWRQHNMREVETGFLAEAASEEASRCLSCGCQICIQKTGCPAISIVANDIMIDNTQCPGCGFCAELCPTKAIIRP